MAAASAAAPASPVLRPPALSKPLPPVLQTPPSLPRPPASHTTSGLHGLLCPRWSASSDDYRQHRRRVAPAP
eukprot:6311880-Prorocentrum_lima.AAC.1